jgi:hypothetical protein
VKPCVICGKMIKKKNSVMAIDYVCSENCKIERKNNLPRKLTILSKQYWINKGYTVLDAERKVSFVQRKRSPRCVEYWIDKGYTVMESQKKVSEKQSSFGLMNLSNYTKEERQLRSPFSKKYWINKGHSEQEAIDIIREKSDNTSLAYYISKYGNDEGNIRYTRLCEYRKKRYTLTGFIKVHGEIKGKLLWSKKFKNRHNSKKASNFFTTLTEHIDEKYKIYTAENENGEYGVKDRKNNLYFFYDFVIPELNLCVEYHGNYWHCNPLLYDESYKHKQIGKNASDIWKKDQIKLDCIRQVKGIDVFVVWESDNYDEKIKEILEKINDTQKN